MTLSQLCPSVIIGFSVAAAVVYLVKGDTSRFIYWIAGASLNAAITFPLPRLPWYN